MKWQWSKIYTGDRSNFGHGVARKNISQDAPDIYALPHRSRQRRRRASRSSNSSRSSKKSHSQQFLFKKK